MHLYSDEFEILNRERNQWSTEEEVRIGWLQALNRKLNIRFHAERGHADADYNQVVIEFKRKGLFRNSSSSAAFQEALEELSRYIHAKARAEGYAAQQYAGIAIDGDSIAFVHITQGGEIAHGPLMPLSLDTVSMVFEACRCSCRKALTAENLIEDFGHGSISGNNLMQVLADGLCQNLENESPNKIKMLFQEWMAVYGQVADLSVSQVSSIMQAIGFYYPSEAQDRLPKILFVIHTFDSIVIKLLAV